MQLYVVGGAVRDALLGEPATDRDWVAVGATPQQLIDQGYKPVGRDFPVFLHPTTNEEVALARTERSTGPGYRGFAVHAAPGVTLEEDLARRDLTINAIAQAEDGTLIDPFNGRADLRARVLRHVSPAFVEDPVRLLRVARFAARFPDFHVAPETMALLRQMVRGGELDALVPERVWQELARGLMAAGAGKPSRMLEVLSACGALVRLLPELGPPVPGVAATVDSAAANAAPLAVRWACLLHAAGCSVAQAQTASSRLKAPNDCLALATMLVREHAALAQHSGGPAEAMVDLLARCDGLRRPERFAALLQAARLCAPALGDDDAQQWSRALSCIKGVDAQAAAQQAGPQDVAAAIRRARIAAVAAALG